MRIPNRVARRAGGRGANTTSPSGRKTMLSLAVAAATASLFPAPHTRADVVIYQDGFTNPGINTGGPYTSSLATTAPTVASEDPASGTNYSGNTWTYDGETGGWGQTGSGVATPTSSNYLAFTPVAGEKYTLSATIDATNWGNTEWFTLAMVQTDKNWDVVSQGNYAWSGTLVRGVYYSGTDPHAATVTQTLDTTTPGWTNSLGLAYVGWITDAQGQANLDPGNKEVTISNFSLTAAFQDSDVVFTNAAPQTLTLTGNNTLTSGPIDVEGSVGNNLVTITGGTIQGPAAGLQIVQNNTSNDLVIASAIADNPAGPTPLTKSGAGRAILSSNNSYSGGTAINGGTLLLSGSGTLGATSNALSVNNGATLDLGGTSQTVAQVNSLFGGGNDAGGTITNGLLAVSTSFVVQGNGNNDGDYGSNPTVTVNANVTVTGDTLIGRSNLTIAGGNFTTNRITANPAGADWADVTISGGTVTATNGIDGTYGTGGGSGTTATFQLDLNGGTLFTPSINVADRNYGFANTARLNLNGTTIMATEDNTNFITTYGYGGAFNAGNNNAYVGNGGAIINTNDHNIGIGVNLVGGGGLTKSGPGTLTLTGNNGYSGGTAINAGTLAAVGNALGTGPVTVSGGTIAVNDGVTPTAQALTTADQTWEAGGGYTARIFNDGSSDQLQITGGSSSLTIDGSVSTATPFTVTAGTTTLGSLDPTVSEDWVIASGITTLNGVTAPTIGNPTVLATAGAGASSAGFVLNVPSSLFSGAEANAPQLELEASGGGLYTVDVVYTAAPEPGAAMLVLGGIVPMLTSRRRGKARTNEKNLRE